VRNATAFYEAGSCQEMSSGWLVHPSIRVSTHWAWRSSSRGLIQRCDEADSGAQVFHSGCAL